MPSINLSLANAFTNVLSDFQELNTRVILTAWALLLVLTILYRYFAAWYHLRHIPGPFIQSWTSLIQVKKMWEGHSHLYYHGLAKKYGPLVRVGPNAVMFSDPDTLRRCSAVRSPYTKGPYYEGSRATKDRDHILSMVDDQKHSELRKKLGPGYSGIENGGFEPSINRTVASFISLIERKYLSTPTSTRPIEFSHRTQFFTLDAVSDVAYSTPFGYLNSDTDLFDYIHLTDAAMPIFMSIMVIPGLYKWLQRWPLSVLMPSSKDKYGLGCMMNFAEKFVDERLRPDAKPKRDIVQSFIKHGVERDQLVQEILIQILAGSDTTATAIRMTLLLLITSPPTLRAVLAEIDKGVKEGRISSPVTNAEAFALPYFQAVVHEGLRLYSPGTGPLYKQVPKGGDTIHGYFLPEGTQVGQNIWGMQRRKEIFGEDADVFRPERWLEAEPGRLKAMKDTVELVFGYGKYMCLGKQMAWMEINKLLVELLRRYDFSLVDPVSPMHLRSATLWMTTNFWLRITRRK